MFCYIFRYYKGNIVYRSKQIFRFFYPKILKIFTKTVKLIVTLILQISKFYKFCMFFGIIREWREKSVIILISCTFLEFLNRTNKNRSGTKSTYKTLDILFNKRHSNDFLLKKIKAKIVILQRKYNTVATCIRQNGNSVVFSRRSHDLLLPL